MKHLVIVGILSCFSMGGFAQIYKDKTAPVEDRTNDLLHRMTLEEKLDYIYMLEDEVLIDGKYQYVSNAIKIYCRSIFDALNENDVSLIKFYRMI